MSEQVYCGQCGSRNPTSNKFCGNCGAVLNVMQESLPDPTPMRLASHPNACPKCGNIDQIQKLSTIITSGTRKTSGVSATMGETNLAGSQRHYAQGTGYVGSSEVSGKAFSASSTLIDATEQSELAKRLSPPPKPQEPAPKRPGFGEWFSTAGGIVAILVGIAGAAWLAGPWGVIGGIVGFIGGVVAASFLAFQFENLVFGTSTELAQIEFERETEKYAKDMAGWEKARQRWDTMYYCYRDDVVFVPGENEAVTPNRLIEFSYQK